MMPVCGSNFGATADMQPMIHLPSTRSEKQVVKFVVHMLNITFVPGFICLCTEQLLHGKAFAICRWKALHWNHSCHIMTSLPSSGSTLAIGMLCARSKLNIIKQWAYPCLCLCLKHPSLAPSEWCSGCMGWFWVQSEIKNELALNKAFIAGTDKHGQPCIFVMGARHDASTRSLEEVRRGICYVLDRASERVWPPSRCDPKANSCRLTVVFRHLCM